jgi:hypothetical protein
MEPRYKELLQGSDEDLFLKGGCHVFALALEQKFHYPLVLVRDNRDGSVPHVFCRSGEFAMVDVMGFTIERDIFDKRLWIQPAYSVEKIAPPEFEKYYVDKRVPGLYADKLFMQQAHDKAEKRITDYMRFYDGTCKCSIGPHPFLKEPSNKEALNIFNDEQ